MTFRTERTIKEGVTYRLHDSMGFQGMIEGVVRVESINAADSLTPQQKFERELWMDDLPPVDKTNAMREAWITAEYTDTKTSGFIHLPADVFAEHISCY